MEDEEEIKFPSLDECLKRSRANRKWWNKWVSDSDDEKPKGVEEFSEGDIELKFPLKRKKYDREYYRESCWWKFLHRDNLDDLSSRDGKSFCNRFTIPYRLFKEFLVKAKEWFSQNVLDAFGKEISPIELKLLGTLRILGKGCSWDLLYELSGVSAEVHRRWTYKFLEGFAREMYHIYVHGPRNNHEMEKVSGVYAASGFPGCIGYRLCPY